MTSRVVFIGLVTFAASVVLSACGITGRTSRFALPLDLRERPPITAEVRVASAAMDANAADLNLVNVLPWGTFGYDDLRNIEESLRDTLAQYPATESSFAYSRLDLHLLIRWYIVSVSNTAGSVLVCVAWAATNGAEALLFDEQFYASDAVYLIGTIGLLKDSVHKAIVGRISTTALSLASDPISASPRPSTFEKTSTSLDEAAARLPSRMISLGNTGLMAVPNINPAPLRQTIQAVDLLSVSGVSTMQWNVVNPSDKFDWAGYPQRVYTRK